MKREINAKISKIESEYDTVREDLKSLNQKIEGVRQRCVDSDKEIRTLQQKLEMILKTSQRGWKIKSIKMIGKRH